MKTKNIVYIIGAVICSTLTVIFRTVALPISLAYDALDAMAFTSDDAAEMLMKNVEGKE